MGYKPDYGLRLVAEGVSRNVDIFFPEFPLYSVTVLGRGWYSTMVEVPRGGESLALSLDFNQTQLQQILAGAPTGIAEHIRAELSRAPDSPREIELPNGITFGVRARLGQLQHAQHEDYVPLVLKEVLTVGSGAAPPQSHSDSRDHCTGLATMEIHLEDVVDLAIPLFQSSEEPPGLVGQCYAFGYDRLVQAAASESDIPWHLWLIGRCLAALHLEHHKRPALAGYTIDHIGQSLVRVFLCAKPLPLFSRASRLFIGCQSHGYIESGRALARHSRFRPLAYWDPPAALYALWPPPRSGDSGPWLLEPENKDSWLSVSTTGTRPVPDGAQLRTVRVPSEPSSAYRVDEAVVHAENRWGVLR